MTYLDLCLHPTSNLHALCFWMAVKTAPQQHSLVACALTVSRRRALAPPLSRAKGKLSRSLDSFCCCWPNLSSTSCKAGTGVCQPERTSAVSKLDIVKMNSRFRKWECLAACQSTSWFRMLGSQLKKKASSGLHFVRDKSPLRPLISPVDMRIFHDVSHAIKKLLGALDVCRLPAGVARVQVAR